MPFAAVRDFLKSRATEAGAAMPADGDNLFDAGVLDSFALADLVALLEREYGLRIPDRDITPAKFQSVDAIDAYIRAAKP